jgi:hypothetical protein
MDAERLRAHGNLDAVDRPHQTLGQRMHCACRRGDGIDMGMGARDDHVSGAVIVEVDEEFRHEFDPACRADGFVAGVGSPNKGTPNGAAPSATASAIRSSRAAMA